MIDVIDLKKSFGDVEVLKGINVTIHKGEMCIRDRGQAHLSDRLGS